MLNCPFAVMSNPVKKPASSANFEQAMKRLEEIVEQMESGDLPLEELIVRYEEGMKLVKVCQAQLDATNPEPNWEFLLRVVDATGKGVAMKNALPLLEK